MGKVVRLPIVAPAPESSERLTDDRRRGSHTRAVRKATYSRAELGRLRPLALFTQTELAGNDAARPRTRGECGTGLRPCPWVTCKFHLHADVSRSGALTLNFPDLEPDQMEASCALDVAGEGGATLDRVGQVMNLTRERIRQIEAAALRKLGVSVSARQLREYLQREDDARRDVPLPREIAMR